MKIVRLLKFISVMLILFLFVGCSVVGLRKELYTKSTEDYQMLCNYITSLNPEVDFGNSIKTLKITSETDIDKNILYYMSIEKQYTDLTEKEKKLIENFRNAYFNITKLKDYEVKQFNKDKLEYEGQFILYGCSIEEKMHFEEELRNKYNQKFQYELNALQQNMNEIADILKKDKNDYTTKVLKTLEIKMYDIF